MENNNRKKFNLCTQGQRLAARALFIIGILGSIVPGSVRAQGLLSKTLKSLAVLYAVVHQGANALELGFGYGDNYGPNNSNDIPGEPPAKTEWAPDSGEAQTPGECPWAYQSYEQEALKILLEGVFNYEDNVTPCAELLNRQYASRSNSTLTVNLDPGFPMQYRGQEALVKAALQCAVEQEYDSPISKLVLLGGREKFRFSEVVGQFSSQAVNLTNVNMHTIWMEVEPEEISILLNLGVQVQLNGVMCCNMTETLGVDPGQIAEVSYETPLEGLCEIQRQAALSAAPAPAPHGYNYFT